MQTENGASSGGILVSVPPTNKGEEDNNDISTISKDVASSVDACRSMMESKKASLQALEAETKSEIDKLNIRLNKIQSELKSVNQWLGRLDGTNDTATTTTTTNAAKSNELVENETDSEIMTVDNLSNKVANLDRMVASVTKSNEQFVAFLTNKLGTMEAKLNDFTNKIVNNNNNNNSSSNKNQTNVSSDGPASNNNDNNEQQAKKNSNSQEETSKRKATTDNVATTTKSPWGTFAQKSSATNPVPVFKFSSTSATTTNNNATTNNMNVTPPKFSFGQKRTTATKPPAESSSAESMFAFPSVYASGSSQKSNTQANNKSTSLFRAPAEYSMTSVSNPFGGGSFLVSSNGGNSSISGNTRGSSTNLKFGIN